MWPQFNSFSTIFTIKGNSLKLHMHKVPSEGRKSGPYSLALSFCYRHLGSMQCMVGNWFNITTVLKFRWLFLIGSRIYKTGGGICIAVILWSIWTSRNEPVFRGENSSVFKIVEQIKCRSLCWAKVANLTSEARVGLWDISRATTMRLHGRYRLKALMDT